MKNILDRPAWSALNTRHALLSEGNDIAKRYPSAVVPFAGTGDDSAASMQALSELVQENQIIVILQADDAVTPPDLTRLFGGAGIQMLANKAMPKIEDERVERLTSADAAEMLALAELTEPGPFTLRSMELGRFWGIKDNGRLVAMAGERMKPEGHTEVSGICTHPDFRGKGYGKLLTGFVAGEIAAGGHLPFLHVRDDNDAAIALYQSVGFKKRCAVNVSVYTRRNASQTGPITAYGLTIHH